MTENNLDIIQEAVNAAKDAARLNAIMYKAYVNSGRTPNEALEHVKDQGLSLNKMLRGQ